MEGRKEERIHRKSRIYEGGRNKEIRISEGRIFMREGDKLTCLRATGRQGNGEMMGGDNKRKAKGEYKRLMPRSLE